MLTRKELRRTLYIAIKQDHMLYAITVNVLLLVKVSLLNLLCIRVCVSFAILLCLYPMYATQCKPCRLNKIMYRS